MSAGAINGWVIWRRWRSCFRWWIANVAVKPMLEKSIRTGRRNTEGADGSDPARSQVHSSSWVQSLSWQLNRWIPNPKVQQTLANEPEGGPRPFRSVSGVLKFMGNSIHSQAMMRALKSAKIPLAQGQSLFRASSWKVSQPDYSIHSVTEISFFRNMQNQVYLRIFGPSSYQWKTFLSR